ncbi:MAG: SHOCT domain-containing protein [Phycisphaeraceae bacterium]|nr:SHOCT domain-containing protein [Phycisphaeraceae bacterium]
MAALIAQTGSVADATREVLFFLGVIVALGLVVGLAGFVIYRRLKRSVDEPQTGLDAGFTLADLRRLHDEGRLSSEEFERARERLLARQARRTSNG